MSDAIHFHSNASQPYHTYRAAVWLTRLGYYKTVEDAVDALISMELYNHHYFKHIMSEYHKVHKFVVGYLKNDKSKNVSYIRENDFRSARGQYGSQPHMSWHK